MVFLSCQILINCTNSLLKYWVNIFLFRETHEHHWVNWNGCLFTRCFKQSRCIYQHVCFCFIIFIPKSGRSILYFCSWGINEIVGHNFTFLPTAPAVEGIKAVQSVCVPVHYSALSRVNCSKNRSSFRQEYWQRGHNARGHVNAQAFSFGNVITCFSTLTFTLNLQGKQEKMLGWKKGYLGNNNPIFLFNISVNPSLCFSTSPSILTLKHNCYDCSLGQSLRNRAHSLGPGCTRH